MTNSTKENTPKKKGPLRIEAIIPIAVFMVVGILYARFMMDSHMRKGMEWTASYIHGAEVNIGKIKTSFFGGTFLLNDLEITDKENPERNLVRVDSMKFNFLWDALLRAKFVVEDSGIEGIQVYSPRDNEGEVFAVEETVDQPINKVQAAILDQTKEDYKDSALGDVANIVDGKKAGDQVGDIRESLKSEKKLDELQVQLDKKKIEWETKLNSLKDKKDLDDLKKQAKAIKFDKKKPWKSAKQYSKVGKAIKQKLKEYKNSSKELKNDMNYFKNGIKQIESLTKEDMNSLQSRLAIPNLNSKDFTEKLVGNLVKKKMAGLYKYVVLAQKYLPAKKSDEEKNTLVPRKRGEGQNYTFPKKGAYPLFWLKRGVISSKYNKDLPFTGNVKGAIANFTTEPVLLGKPAIIKFEGDFPGQKVMGVKANINLDHTKNIPKENIRLSVRSYPVTNQSFSESESMKFGINKATGSTKVNALIKGNAIDANIRNTFGKVDYRMESSSEKTKELLSNILKGIPSVNITARARGIVSELNWNIRSNLGSEISKGLKREISKQIGDKKKELKAKIDNKLKGKKEKLMKSYSSVKNKITGLLGKKDKEMDSAGKDALGSTKGKKSGLGGLIKKFKLPF